MILQYESTEEHHTLCILTILSCMDYSSVTLGETSPSLNETKLIAMEEQSLSNTIPLGIGLYKSN